MRVGTRHLTLLVAAVALTAGVSAAPAAKRKPLVTAKVIQCAKGATPADRYAVFRGGMRRVAGTDRMWIKFRLQERTGSGRYRTVAAPGLGIWRRSRSGVRRFAVRQRVLELGEGASYRVSVQYRWVDGDGDVRRRARRRTPACRQTGLLPNLRVLRIGGRRVNGTVRYSVDVVNRGRAPSPATDLSLSVDGDVVDTPSFAALAPGATRRVFVNGPPCARSVRAKVDAAGVVAEGSEADNSRLVPCPLS